MKTVSLLALLSLIPAAWSAGATPSNNLTGGAAPYDELAKSAAAIKPNVKNYKVKRSLSNVANRKLFAKELTKDEKRLLAKNLFVLSPTSYVQFFHVYENNEYQRPLKFPAFITTDSMLHTYHVFYDYSLRTVESNKLYEACAKLTSLMFDAAKQDYADAKNPGIKLAAQKNVAYFGVAMMCFNKAQVPDVDSQEIKDAIAADWQQIQAHAGRATSKALGYKWLVDFSQFVPRGHYTRSEKLKNYFKAMMWYGNVGLPLTGPDAQAGKEPTRQALLIVRDLRRNPEAMNLWHTIYEPTVFYVGKADDCTADAYGKVSDKVFGANPDIEAFADDAKLNAFVAAARTLPGPKIDNTTPNPLVAKGLQFRFMGQRFIPDSRVLQELTHPKVWKRSMPAGLDVFAALGSERALELLKDEYRVDSFKSYESQMAKLRKELIATPKATWMSNLYYGWLWTLRSLTTPAPAGYPAFMRGTAWLDKDLLTGLGSWTELRHDTILYAKQSVAECGDGAEEPPLPKGYVEPALDVWVKLQWLNASTQQGLEKRGILDSQLKDTFTKIGDWLDFCRKISIKELTGVRVTREEYEQMTVYGADLESLQRNFAGGDIISEADKDMALVADVHTDAGRGEVLEEGTGRAAVIYVVVPIEGKLYITRGAAYTHYEFEHPIADRLTDEKWQKMLKDNAQPAVAPWVGDIMTRIRKALKKEFEASVGGC